MSTNKYDILIDKVRDDTNIVLNSSLVTEDYIKTITETIIVLLNELKELRSSDNGL